MSRRNNTIVRLSKCYRGEHRRYIYAQVVLKKVDGEWKLIRGGVNYEVSIKALGIHPSEGEAYARKFQGMLYRYHEQRDEEGCWEVTAVRQSDRQIESLSTLLLQESKVHTYDWCDRDDRRDAVEIWQEMKGTTDHNWKGAPINWWRLRDPDAPTMIRAYRGMCRCKSDNTVESLANFLRVDIERGQELYDRYLAHVRYR